MPAPFTTTLLDLVQAISAEIADDREIVAIITALVNSGRVRLGGTFAGAKIALPPTDAPQSSLPLNIVRSIVTPE